MKIASGRFAKIIKAICIALTIGIAVCYTTSCSIDILDSILNSDPTNPNGNDGNQDNHQKPSNPDDNGSGGETVPSFPGEHTDYPTQKNLILNVDFDNNNTHEFKGLNALYDTDRVFMKWNSTYRPSELLKNNHGRVLRLEANPSNYSNMYDESAYAYVEARVDTPSTFTFEYKTDIWQNYNPKPKPNPNQDPNQEYIKDPKEDNRLKFFIYKKDSSGNYVKHTGRDLHFTGFGDGWRTFSWELPMGDLRISIELRGNNTYGNPPIQNLVYIDNVTIAPNKIEYVDIYPKGLQETRVGGNRIRFEAVPKRSDGSVIEGADISYSVTGPGSIDNTGLFTPSNSGFGKCTLTAYVNGKAYTKSNIYVHQKEYLLDSVNIGNYTFNGNGQIYDLSSIDADRYNPITTDGFIVLKGYANEPLVIRVTKDDHEASSDYYYTDTFIRQGSFKTRIWLRFGKGKHIVEIYKPNPTLKYYDTGDPKYLGDLAAQSFSMTREKSIYVNNTSEISEKDAMVLMPSQVVQADELSISNVAHHIVSDLPSNPSKGDVLRSVHDFVIRNLYYDLKSVGSYGNKRKVQDAVHTLQYKMGVCEGYANLYAAICRNLGLKVKVVSGLATPPGGHGEQHAWNHVEYGGKWYMVDATWDDPIQNGVSAETYNDRAPYGENYSFFMVAPSDGGHPGEKPDLEVQDRSIVTPVDNDTITCVVGEGCY